jgi:hypothetical protein
MYFIGEYLKGLKLPRIIFEEAGFNIEMVGIKQYEQSAALKFTLSNLYATYLLRSICILPNKCKEASCSCNRLLSIKYRGELGEYSFSLCFKICSFCIMVSI